MKIMVDSEYLDKLKKNLGFKEDGSLEVGKNLEVDGTTKMNGGFEPIHTYQIKISENQTFPLNIWSEVLYNDDTYQFLGDFDTVITIGSYTISSGKVTALQAFWMEDSEGLTSQTLMLNEDTGLFEQYDTSPVTVNGLKTIFGDQPLVGEGNIDLYRHKLNVQGANGANASWVYYTSSSNLECDSVQDLRTLLKVGDIPVWAPGNLAAGTFAPIYLYVSSSSCVIKTSETESTPVISVSDKVTTI